MRGRKVVYPSPLKIAVTTQQIAESYAGQGVACGGCTFANPKRGGAHASAQRCGVAHQKIIRNIAATLEALVGMGCGEMLRRGGKFGGGWRAKTGILPRPELPIDAPISSEVTRYGNSDAQIYANQRQSRHWLLTLLIVGRRPIPNGQNKYVFCRY